MIQNPAPTLVKPSRRVGGIHMQWHCRPCYGGGKPGWKPITGHLITKVRASLACTGSMTGTLDSPSHCTSKGHSVLNSRQTLNPYLKLVSRLWQAQASIWPGATGKHRARPDLLWLLRMQSPQGSPQELDVSFKLCTENSEIISAEKFRDASSSQMATKDTLANSSCIIFLHAEWRWPLKFHQLSPQPIMPQNLQNEISSHPIWLVFSQGEDISIPIGRKAMQKQWEMKVGYQAETVPPEDIKQRLLR